MDFTLGEAFCPICGKPANSIVEQLYCRTPIRNEKGAFYWDDDMETEVWWDTVQAYIIETINGPNHILMCENNHEWESSKTNYYEISETEERER